MPAPNANETSPAADRDDVAVVLALTDDPDGPTPVREALERADRFEVHSPSPGTAARLDDVDCVVVDCDLPAGDRGLLAAARERVPALPIVRIPCETADEDGSVRADALERLPERLDRALADRRAGNLARRTLAAVESATDGIAVVAPDGTLEVVNRAYARTFDYDREELLGRPWTDLYTDAEVERLTETALPTVADGWRWTGHCTGRRRDGGTVTARTNLVGLEDGSLVFTTLERGGSDEGA